jgi:hypothetical protein
VVAGVVAGKDRLGIDGRRAAGCEQASREQAGRPNEATERPPSSRIAILGDGGARPAYAAESRVRKSAGSSRARCPVA